MSEVVIPTRETLYPVDPDRFTLTTLSHSQVEAYERCPYGYYLQYVIRLKPPPSHYLAFGSLIHEILELDAISQKNGEGKLPVFTLLRLYKERWKPQEMAFPDQATEQEYLALGRKMLMAYAKRPPEEILEVEYGFELDLGIGVPIIGFIDKVIRQDGRLKLVDYKTGKTYTKEKLERADQLALYSLAAEALWPDEQQPIVAYDFLADKEYEVPITDEVAWVVVDRFAAAAQAIQAKRFQRSCQESFWCRRVCSYGRYGLCPLRS